MTRATRVAMRIGTLALALIIISFLASAIPFRQIIDQRSRLDEARAELAAIEIENGLLANEVLALDTPGEIERMAREKLGYVMPGEIGFVVLASEPTSVIQDPIATPAAEVPWWRRIWDFLSGADSSG
ncbi:MAG: septum formation initiator family protein [Acidimicrobiia bacterium]|nr:septum formation initiator family protein [Acidimicrobiia bacterium]MDQ3500121.1 septum formation initiator family protein [Actinomycetota bacterium]